VAVSTDVHEIRASSTTFCIQLSYQFSWKSDERFSRWS